MIPLLIILSSLSLKSPEPGNLRWSYVGHRIVCEIAWQHLTPESRESVLALLSTDSEFDYFSDSCSWADGIRQEPRFERFNTAHYVNLPSGADGIDVARDCANDLCVVQVILEQKAILASLTSTAVERLEALKFISHFVGDIHQPLHVSYLDDRGGNWTQVTIWGEPRNMHQVWDWVLVDRSQLSSEAYAAQLLEDITAIDRTLWASPSVEEWANESFQITEDYAYDFDPYEELGDEYYLTNLHALEDQLKKAGIRLAALLNEVFLQYGTTGTANESALPETTRLENNYPNPFSLATNIRFDVPFPDHVQLTVFNLIGQEVARLVDGRLSATSHELTWDASGMPTGLYFYQLTAGGLSSETKTMVVVR